VKTRVLTITLAAILALAGVVAILAYVRHANERAVNGLKAETVLYAYGAIPAGTSLSQAETGHLLGTETVPASSLTYGSAVQAVTKANGAKVVIGTVAKGQVLLQNMLARAGTATASSGSGFVIPQGDIAVAVDMCVPEDVANYVTPDSYVAVFDTLLVVSGSQQPTPSCSSEHPALGNAAIQNTTLASTVLVLAKVQVLAVGPNPGSQSTSGSSNVAAATDPASSSSSSGDVLVTFAVDQTDAQKLILLQEVGIPYLALLPQNSNGPSGGIGPQGAVQLFG
jgi:pilus assembly protein CpaB